MLRVVLALSRIIFKDQEVDGEVGLLFVRIIGEQFKYSQDANTFEFDK